MKDIFRKLLNLTKTINLILLKIVKEEPSVKISLIVKI